VNEIFKLNHHRCSHLLFYRASVVKLLRTEPRANQHLLNRDSMSQIVFADFGLDSAAIRTPEFGAIIK